MIISDIEKNRNKFTGKIYFDYNINKLNWFNIGGKASIYFKPETLKDLTSFLSIYKQRGKIFLVGAGSNVLFKDEEYEGAIIKLSKNFSNISLLKDNIIVAGSAVLDKNISATAIAKWVGTSTEMIDKFYTAHMALESMLEQFNKVRSSHLKVV